MKVQAEIFKGIEFIRISNLPEGQKEFIIASIPKDNIIKILRDGVVMNDCIQYHNYLFCYSQYKNQSTPVLEMQPNSKRVQSSYKFAFK